MGGQLLKNIVFLALFAEKHPQVTKKKKKNVTEEQEAEDGEQEEEASDSDGEDDDEQKGQTERAPLRWLVARLSVIAKRGHALQVRWLAFM